MCLVSDIPARMVVVKLEPKVPHLAEGWIGTGGHPQNLVNFMVDAILMVILW